MLFEDLIDLDAAIDFVENPRFINEQPATTESELESILQGTTTTYDNRDGNDQISLLPKCACGYLHFRGAEKYTCSHCNTRPVAQVEKFVKSTMWFKKPDGFTLLINPVIFHMLQRRFSMNGWDAIAFLTDPYYKSTNKIPSWLDQLQRQNFGRGWNNFIKKFDTIMTFLFNLTAFKVAKDEVDYLLLLLQLQSDRVFCSYLPVPNKVMFPYEKTNFCIYRSNSAGLASSFVQAMLSIDSPIQQLSQKSRESRMAKLYRSLSEYQFHHIKHEISPKEGDVRRHNLGSKTVLSGRAIIISKTGPQDHQEFGIPWFMVLGAFRPIFINKLTRRGYTLNQAVNILRQATSCYTEVISEIMDEMLREAPEGKMWALFDRNPSLKHGSMQLGSIYFKRDPSDKCIDFPMADVKSPNADFDGDQINVMFMLDGFLIAQVDTFLPWTNVFELTKPFRMSKNVFVSGPQVSCYSNWLRHAKERPKNYN